MLKLNMRIAKLGIALFFLVITAIGTSIGAMTVLYVPQVAASCFSLLNAPASQTANAADTLKAAWQHARDAGSYQFDGDVTQVTLPTARITNVGAAARAPKCTSKAKPMCAKTPGEISSQCHTDQSLVAVCSTLRTICSRWYTVCNAV